MRLRIDQSVQAAYLTVRSEPIVTTREIGSDVIVDYSADGSVVGIEVLNIPDGEPDPE
jgi:uncharacterized protein YuzE